ncbi:MAG: type II 3-dehydroquinate dehydratase [Bacteroidales bacterium]|jgi:3-dehydroquinate dehydratase-2|nr:type II 3-dehydroquinate dehydratase [Bacteroidales bacterium]
MKHIIIINGANLNLLGTREPNIYGSESFDEFLLHLRTKYPHIEISFFQSNVEGSLVDALQASEKLDGVILNAGGYTHTSVVIRDAVVALQIPVIEVHISNIMKREEFRHTSLLSSVCSGTIFGFGLLSYELAVIALQNKMLN